ncbi:23680_t:CDS:2, partial [Gigaspora margarita]
MDIMQKIKNSNLVELVEDTLGTPKDYTKLYKSCLNFEPERRPSLDKILSELRRLSKDASIQFITNANINQKCLGYNSSDEISEILTGEYQRSTANSVGEVHQQENANLDNKVQRHENMNSIAESYQKLKEDNNVKRYEYSVFKDIKTLESGLFSECLFFDSSQRLALDKIPKNIISSPNTELETYLKGLKVFNCSKHGKNLKCIGRGGFSTVYSVIFEERYYALKNFKQNLMLDKEEFKDCMKEGLEFSQISERIKDIITEENHEPQNTFDRLYNEKNNNNSEWLCLLGFFYLEGIGTEKNHKIALNMFEKAKSGYAKGNIMAKFYLEAAIQWYNKSADNGHKIAMNKLNSINR